MYLCDDYSKMLCVSASYVSHTLEKKIVLKVSFFTPHDEYAFIEDKWSMWTRVQKLQNYTTRGLIFIV